MSQLISQCQEHKSELKFFCISDECNAAQSRFCCQKCPLEENYNHSGHQLAEIQEVQNLQSQQLIQYKKLLEAYTTKKTQIEKNKKDIESNSQLVEKELAHKEISTIFSSIRNEFLAKLQEQEDLYLRNYDNYYNAYVEAPVPNIKSEVQQSNSSSLDIETLNLKAKQDEILVKETLKFEKEQERHQTYSINLEQISQQNITDQNKFYEVIFKSSPLQTYPAPPIQPIGLRKSKKSEKIEKASYQITQNLYDFYSRNLRVIQDTVFQNFNEQKLGTDSIKMKKQFPIHTAYDIFQTSKMELVSDQNLLYYTNMVRDQYPAVFQFSEINIETQNQKNLATFDREILSFAVINPETIIFGLNNFNQVYMYQPENMSLTKESGPQLIPYQLSLFEGKITTQLQNCYINTLEIVKFNETQFLVYQTCGIPMPSGKQKVLDCLALCEIIKMEGTTQKFIRKSLEYEQFEGKVVDKTLLLDNGLKFVQFYNERETDYYAKSDYKNHLRVFGNAGVSPIFSFDLTDLEEFGFITSVEKLSETVFLLASYVDFYLISLDLANKQVYLLDKQKSTGSFYKPLAISATEFCFYDGNKTQFWEIRDEQMYEKNTYMDPQLLVYKNPVHGGEIITFNQIINEQTENQKSRFIDLNLSIWDRTYSTV